MEIDKLFFELLQVSVGQLDCLTRGPSPEEWDMLYEMSRRQNVVGLCYQGLQRLFEFGLRAPQDISIDWMAAAEEAESSVKTMESMMMLTISNPVRNFVFHWWKKQLGGSFYMYVGQKKEPTDSASVVILLMQYYELFNSGKLTMNQLMDLYEILNKSDFKLIPFRDESTVKKALRKMGIWTFSCAVMWVLGEAIAMKPERMVCPPNAATGRFVLQDIMTIGTKIDFSDRMKRKLWRFVRF